MAQRHFNISRGTLFISFLIVGIMLLVIPERHTGKLNGLFLRFFNPVLSIGPSMPEFIPKRAPSSEEYVSRQEYDQLWRAYHNMGQMLQSVQEENEKLAGLRTGLPKLGGGFAYAKVVRTSISGYGHELVINKGSDAGVEKGQYVLGPNIRSPDKSSIVGSISEVSAGTSTVRLLTDLKHNILVKIRHEGGGDSVAAPMKGGGKEACEIPLLSITETEVSEGDAVYAVPQTGLLDTAVVVGKVGAAKPAEDNPVVWDITVKPAYEVEQLVEVAVIVMIAADEG